MTHNSSEHFLPKHYTHWIKRAHQSTIFQTFECFNERTMSGFIQILYITVSVMKNNYSVFF